MKKVLPIFLIVVFSLFFVGNKFFKIEKDEVVGYTVVIRENKKIFFKKVAKKLKKVIYYEATKHNPKGDLFPDQIDDELIGEIRKKIN